jgi:acyl-CoA synthetase (AMP-forming)/AMP-acid ligase II
MEPDGLTPRTIGDVTRKYAALRPNAVAHVFEGRQTTFAEFDWHTNQIANGLLRLGIARQDHVAYLGKNSDSYFELLYGAAKACAVLTPINWRLAPPEIAYIVNDCQAEILFIGPEFVETVRALAPNLRRVTTIIVMEGAVGPWPAFSAWRDAQSADDPHRDETEQDIAIQLYTSGTTGHPKGAMLTHRNLIGLRGIGLENLPDWNKWTSDDVALVAMPCFHIGGTGWQTFAMYFGATSIIAREFNPASVLEDFEKYRISKVFLVPAAMQAIVRHPKSREVDYSRLQFMLYGASPIPLDLLRECIGVFRCGFVQVYGMTETSGTFTVLPPEDHDPAGSPRMRSAGKPLPGVDVVILDADGARLPPGEVGEIATRSLANMAGYWNLPDATARTIDKDGWLRTGDAGYCDEDGYIYVHDRVKDMIISGGENIYPAEVESAIFGHPAIADVAVIGVPDERWGEAVKAIVVLKSGAEASLESIASFARERIASYKIPKSVDFIAALPRNASGKILRRQLREPYWVGKDRRVN